MSGPILIVGGGIAAQSVAEQIRDRDADVEITMLSAEAHAPYDRVRLSNILAGDDTTETLRLRPAEWYDDRRVDLRLATEVASVDRDRRTLTTIGGEHLSYGKLVIATGSHALVPRITGIDLPGVCVFRTPEDCAAILAGAETATSACVIGGGLLGLEAARGLVDQGVATTVVHLMDRLMERQVDGPAGQMLLDQMKSMDIEVLLQRDTVEIVGTERVEALRFADGTEQPCDLVVVSIGIRPNVELARAAELEINRGIVVDDVLRTSDQHVFAVGECAEHRGNVYGLVSPIHEQARVAAAAIVGSGSDIYEGSIPATALKVMGVSMLAVGDISAPGGAAHTDHEAGRYRRLVVRDGRAVGAILMGDAAGGPALASLVQRNAEVMDPLAALAESARADVWDLPDSAQICDCNGVSKGDILGAIRDRGLKAPSEVTACTRAGAGCGSCKPLVAQLTERETGVTGAEAAYVCPCLSLTRDDIAGVISEQGLRSASQVTAACGAGRDCAACKPAIAYMVELANGNRHDEERQSRFVNDRVHANIQRDGTFSVVPRIYGGVTTPDELRRIADAAEKYDVGMVKITGGQRIDLLGVKKEDLPAIWEDLGMPSGMAYAKAMRTVKTCVGTDFCRFGVGDAISLGIEMEKAWEGLRTPHKVKSAVSGCPRNCAESLVKDIGVVAVEGGWEILIGGAAGSTIRRGDLLARVETADQALALASTFLQYYRENGEYLERTYGFVERVGIETIRDACLDEESGEPARLRERLALARASARDPWEEAIRNPDRRSYTGLGEDPEPALVGPPPDGVIS